MVVLLIDTPAERMLRDLTWLLTTRDGLLILIAVFGSIEIALLCLAFILVPWSAMDEPPRRTYRNTLRVVWLWTGTAVPFIVLHVAAVNSLTWFARTWSDMPTPLYHLFLWWARGPLRWIARHHDELTFAIGVVIAHLTLYVLLAAGATPRMVPPRARPPICEGCGYNLSHIPTGGLCPECGTPVGESLRPGVHRPKKWEQGANLQPLGKLLGCAFEAAFRKRRFFRTMTTRRGMSHARMFLILFHALSLLTFPLCGLWIGLNTGNTLTTGDAVDICGLSLIVAALALLWTLTMAAVVGVYVRLAWGLEAMCGVAKVFSYLHGLLVFLCIVWALAAYPVPKLASMADRHNWRIGTMDAEVAIIMCWVRFWVVFLAGHLCTAMAGVAQIRYANA